MKKSLANLTAKKQAKLHFVARIIKRHQANGPKEESYADVLAIAENLVKQEQNKRELLADANSRESSNEFISLSNTTKTIEKSVEIYSK